MVVFNQKLLITANASLYQLKSSSFDDKWEFKKVDWAPENITFINASLNGRYLFIKADLCYLFDDTLYSKVIKRNITKRIYGNDTRSYIDFKNTTCKVYINKKKVQTLTNIVSAAFNKNNDLFLVKLVDGYKNVKIINNQPYYIK